MPGSEIPTVSLCDPLLHEVDLPLRAICYPLGFRLDLATNSQLVIQAAEEAWSAYQPEFARPPLSIRIIVRPEGEMADEQPVFRGQGDLFSIIYDRHNFGVYGTHSPAGYCFVSEKTAANNLRLRIHFLEAMTYSMLAQRHAVPVHAAAVMRGGTGFLFCGPSGAGKTTLAYACARSGWTFVSDDATWLPAGAEGRTAIGRPRHARFRRDAPRLFPELAQYIAVQRPNGKMTIEAATAHFPAIHTAVHCDVDHLVSLNRRPGSAGRIKSIPAEGILEGFLTESSTYGERVRQMHERTLQRLLGAAAWELEYETLEQALQLFATIR